MGLLIVEVSCRCAFGGTTISFERKLRIVVTSLARATTTTGWT